MSATLAHFYYSDMVATATALCWTGNALVLSGNHKSRKKDKNKVEKDRKKSSQCLSKNQQRKLCRLQEEKDKRARRSNALEILEKHKLGDDASTDGKLNADNTSKAGLNIEQSDMSIEHDTGSSIRLSMDRCSTGDEQDHSLTSTEQVLAVTKVIVPQSNNDKAFASSHLLGLDNERGSGSTSVISQNENAKLNVGENESIDAIRRRKYQVSEGDSQKLDTQTSGASKGFQCAPLATNFVVHVSRPPDVEESRKNLPIIMMEQEIMEAVSHHSVVIICG